MIIRRRPRSALEGIIKDLDATTGSVWSVLTKRPTAPTDVMLLNREALSHLGLLRAALKERDGTPERDGNLAIAAAIDEALPGLVDLANRLGRVRGANAEPIRAAIGKLIVAEARASVTNGGESTTRHVRIGSDLLYQIHAAAVPAERMFVVPGRSVARDVILGPSFDVTGAAGQIHCHADPSRLAQALIAMENAGCHLAMWVHSHPGSGPGSTSPSSIDTAQHREWLRDYSTDLVSGTVVEDGWVRLWGTALEHDFVDIEIVGKGVDVVSRGRDVLLRLTTWDDR
jgi:proteasome lid subunit RPN8/RPN11